MILDDFLHTFHMGELPHPHPILRQQPPTHPRTHIRTHTHTHAHTQSMPSSAPSPISFTPSSEGVEPLPGELARYGNSF